MDPSSRRYQLSTQHNPSPYEIIDAPRELNDWNPYDVPWDTKRSSRVSCTPIKETLSKYTSSDVDHQSNINGDEWYCDSGSSSSSTSSNDRTTPRRSRGSPPPEDRNRQPGAARRPRLPQGGEDTVQKRNKKTTSGRKVSLTKDGTVARNNKQIQGASTAEEVKAVKTDEIALFMRCKKRPYDVEVQPIPPSPGGWDDVIPEQAVNWGERKAHSSTKKAHGQQTSWISGNEAKMPRDEKIKKSLRHERSPQYANRPKSSARTSAKFMDIDRRDMPNMNANSQDVNSAWREKHATRPQAIINNDMSSSYFDVTMPMENRYKQAGQFYAPTHPAYADMGTTKAYPPSDMLPSKSNPLNAQRQWRREKESAFNTQYAQETPQMMSNEQAWRPDSFASHWDSQPHVLYKPEQQHPTTWKERKCSLDSFFKPQICELNAPTSSMDGHLQSGPNWPSLPSIWSVGAQETNQMRPRRASADVDSSPTAPRLGSVDWRSPNSLEDWSSMNKNVGSLMRLLEEDVAPMPARIPHAKNIQDNSCHPPADHHHRLFDNDKSTLRQPSCNHCGAVSDRKVISGIQDPSWR